MDDHVPLEGQVFYRYACGRAQRVAREFKVSIEVKPLLEGWALWAPAWLKGRMPHDELAAQADEKREREDVEAIADQDPEVGDSLARRAEYEKGDGLSDAGWYRPD